MELLNQILKSAPEVALFAALFLGCALGRVKFKGFSLGGVAGSLIVALVIGQLGVTLPDALKAVCFALFIYSVGFKSGPEFFGGLNRSSFKLVLSSVVQCVAALVALLVVAHLCGFGKGYAAGVGAGCADGHGDDGHGRRRAHPPGSGRRTGRAVDQPDGRRIYRHLCDLQRAARRMGTGDCRIYEMNKRNTINQ